MITIKENKNCNGCYACATICPKNCISMVVDEEGFWYPKVNLDLCVDCGLCEKTCPILSKDISLHKSTKAYAAISKKEDVRKESSSGGIFSEIAEWVLERNGVVFGAAFETDFSVQHTYVENPEQLHIFRGSKYVQSKIGDTYSEAKRFLDSGRWVLFSGTPCQIGGLLAFLNKPYEHLLTLDLACHGVPSPKVWQTYLKYRKEKNGMPLSKVSFRSKITGWKHYSMECAFEQTAQYFKPYGQDAYFQAFLANLSLRPSCYDCAFKSLMRQSDFMLADFWGIEKLHPEMDDDKGTSLVFVNTSKAEMVLEDIEQRLILLETSAEQSARYNSAIYSSVAFPKNRKRFFQTIFKERDFEKSVNKCVKVSFSRRCLGKIKRILKGEKQ